MHPAGCRTPIVIGLIALLLSSSTASAQTGTYIAGAGFADVRLFDGASSPTLFGEDISRDATGAGGSIRVGTWVHPRWTLEVGADIASRTTASFQGPVIAIFPPVPRLELRSSTSFVSVTTMVGFHSPAGRRVRMGYLAGFSFVRATHKNEIPFDELSFFTFDSIGFSTSGTTGPFTSLSRSSLTLPSGALSSKQNSGALTLGIEAAIDLTPKFAVVPELRASTLSGVFLIRPGVGARWSF
jgi:hypothetical protein